MFRPQHPSIIKENEETPSNSSSGSHIIDSLIEESYRISKCPQDALGWIPFEIFGKVECFAQGEFAEIALASCRRSEWQPVAGYEKEIPDDVALRFIKNSRVIDEKLINEIRTHHKCMIHSRNVIPLYGLTQDPRTLDHALVLKHARHGDLREFLRKNLTWPEKLRMLIKIAKTLKEIHELDLVHRDFHCKNILVDDNDLLGDGYELFVSDFGLCMDVSSSKTDLNVIEGVLPYIAPEILLGSKYSPKTDIYSFSMIMWELVSDQSPYHEYQIHDIGLALDIIKGVRPMIPDGTPEDFRDLINACWSDNPAHRPDSVRLLMIFKNMLRICDGDENENFGFEDASEVESEEEGEEDYKTKQVDLTSKYDTLNNEDTTIHGADIITSSDHQGSMHGSKICIVNRPYKQASDGTRDPAMEGNGNIFMLRSVAIPKSVENVKNGVDNVDNGPIQQHQMDAVVSDENQIDPHEHVTNVEEYVPEDTYMNTIDSQEASPQPCMNTTNTQEVLSQSHMDATTDSQKTSSQSYMNETDSQKVLSQSHTNVINPQEVSSQSYVITTDPQEVLSQSQENVTNSQEAPSQSHNNVKNSQTAPSGKVTEMSQSNFGSDVDLEVREVPQESTSVSLPQSIDLPLKSESESPPMTTDNHDSNTDGEESDAGDPTMERMFNMLNSLITEATASVEAPVRGREKNLYKQFDSSKLADLDFSDINNALDEYEQDSLDDDDESFLDEDEEESSSEFGEEECERGRDFKRGNKTPKRSKSRNEELFEYSMSEFNKSLTEFATFVDEMTMTDDTANETMHKDGHQYWDPEERPSWNHNEPPEDLDDFTQHCHFLTRALILPFLKFTHTFMSESIRKEEFGTVRSVVYAIYWTFLFTLGALALDSQLCLISGRQVIRLLIKLGQLSFDDQYSCGVVSKVAPHSNPGPPTEYEKNMTGRNECDHDPSNSFYDQIDSEDPRYRTQVYAFTVNDIIRILNECDT